MNGLPNPFVPDSATFADAAVTLRPAPSPGVTVALTPDPVHPCRDNSAAPPAISEAAAFSSVRASPTADRDADMAAEECSTKRLQASAVTNLNLLTPNLDASPNSDRVVSGAGKDHALIPAMIANVLRMRSLPYSNTNRFDQYFDEPAFVRALGGEGDR